MGASADNVSGATNTSSYRVTAVSIVRNVTVPGYGTTVLYLNGDGLNGSGTFASSLSATASPLISACPLRPVRSRQAWTTASPSRIPR